MNIRGFITHAAEVAAMIRCTSPKPTFVALNETFLPQIIASAELEDYVQVIRRDREEQWGGGILLFAHKDYAASVTHLENSVHDKRGWAMIHTEQSPYLLGVWYRPPAPGRTGSITNCEAEWRRLSPDAMGTIIVGDPNVHSKKWLKFSARESTEGTEMHSASARMGLRQLVSEPTRGEYLLDITLSDIPKAKARTVAAVADHRGVISSVKFAMPKTIHYIRTTWLFRSAD